jgi:subtilisin family serine protease
MTALTTGRLLVLLGEDTARARRHLARADHRLLDRVGVAVVAPTVKQAAALRAAAANPDLPEIVACEPERIVSAITSPSADYLTGYRDGVADLVARLGGATQIDGPAAVWDDTAAATWGCQAVGAVGAGATGAGARIAVLDTGLALAHPDFAGRAGLVTESFVEGETVEDRNGHGTHCAGVVAGPARPAEGARYGVAPSCELYVGKVLGDDGSGSDGDILAGIDWAVAAGCHAISLSLGAGVDPDEPYSEVFEAVAQRALAQGSLLIAAAGNDSRRSRRRTAPVSHPANCPSIVAVAAVDRTEAVADFSNGTVGTAGQVDLAGPGIDVRSAWAGTARYRVVSGTSMATPHVAGVAALLRETHQPATAAALVNLLLWQGRRLPVAATDAGAGMARWFAAPDQPATASTPSRRLRTQTRA